MTIKPGDRLPAIEFTVSTAEGPQKMSADVLFSGRKVVLFGLPGAFTPTCNMNHLPGFLLAFLVWWVQGRRVPAAGGPGAARGLSGASPGRTGDNPA